MDYSLIITAWKEPLSVASNIGRILDEEYKNLLPSLEIILAAPDEETYVAARKEIEARGFTNFVYIKDPQKGKPTALNMAFNMARGGIIICTDGDVLLDVAALPALVAPFNDPSVGIVTGRPASVDPKGTMFGYFGNLLADSAHSKRKKEFDSGGFYFVSGYLYAMRNVDGFQIPTDSLVDDAWITLQYVKSGVKVGYAPDARVLIKYPKNMDEWVRQKKRSIGGYRQLAAINLQLPVDKRKTRGILEELSFVLFPIQYATNVQEYFYSLCLYPARLWLWVVIWWERYVHKKSFEKTWTRIESTK
jgi:poly-beta-1,6-N-acetyl-D-glucosamine synthase